MANLIPVTAEQYARVLTLEALLERELLTDALAELLPKGGSMANLIPVTAEQYARVLAFRDACTAVAELLFALKKARVPGTEGIWRMLARQAKALDDLPVMPEPAHPGGTGIALTGQKLRWCHKLVTSAFRAAALLDQLRHDGVNGGTEIETWNDMREQAQALGDLPKGT